MRKRDLPLTFMRDQAELFGVTPELYWLMETRGIWDKLVNTIRESNHGMVVGKGAYPIDELRVALATLEALISE